MSQTITNADFEALLEYVKRSRGFDFTGYKRSSLMRRVTKRMQAVEIDSYGNYVDYLEVHPEEFNFLFNTLLINVTAFFRDRFAWDYVISEIIPQIVARHQPNGQIRVWSAGCASGEEAYTAAMVIADAIGIEQFRDRVKIYATDLDEEALQQARQAEYSLSQLDGVSPEQIEMYFERLDDRYTFRKDLRRAVIFGRHDLIQDAPISRIDLLLCRNALMYFNAETQAKILARLHFALRNDGFLFLGKAEMLLAHGKTFTPVELKSRVFAKMPKLNVRDRLLAMSQTNYEKESNSSNHGQLREAAFDRSPWACIVINADGLLAMVNERARLLFNLNLQDLGRPLQDLELSYRPVELRSCIEQAYNEQRTIVVRSTQFTSLLGETIHLDVQVLPLFAADQILGASVTFIDVGQSKRLQEELQQSNQELEMAYEELQSSNEELETTNEELQSTNEELETTNEELQSTNEELETMNEELQSTNEELQTVNDEFQRSSEELAQINAFLESILISLKGAVVVVDRNLHVQVWNHKAEDLWGLRTEEALGQNFLNLDIGLPVAQLRQAIRECLTEIPAEPVEITLSAINRRGKSIQSRTTCTSLIGPSGNSEGAILIME